MSFCCHAVTLGKSFTHVFTKKYKFMLRKGGKVTVCLKEK